MKELNKLQNIRTFTVRTKYVFNGEYYIKAKSRKEARKMVRENCGLCLGNNIHSTMPDEDVNWDFEVHPQEIVY